MAESWGPVGSGVGELQGLIGFPPRIIEGNAEVVEGRSSESELWANTKKAHLSDIWL